MTSVSLRNPNFIESEPEKPMSVISDVPVARVEETENEIDELEIESHSGLNGPLYTVIPLIQTTKLI